MAAASGIGHQNRISIDLELAMFNELLMFHRNQKMLGASGSGLQHCLHYDALWGFVICRHHQLLL
jgi:hypothetical protein